MASISDSETTNHGSIWDLDQNLDQPMDEEASRLKNMYTEKKFSSILLLRLAFQSLGVVFGDLGTSPLYVFYNIFPHGVDEDEDVIGALSLIIYTITLIPLMKYVFVVLRANDNGQDFTHRRHVRSLFFTLPACKAKVKRWLEGRPYKKNCLLILVLIGTCTAIGDGILTPAISVLSASGGIRVQNQKMSTDVVVVVAVIILIGLFSMQHYGTDKVGWLFAPIVLLWFILIGTIGALNIHKYNNSVLKAYNPVYIYRYFRRGKSESWTSLGGIMLSITGTEALYADLCHFPVFAIQIAFTLVVFPCLLLAYTGQAAYIISNKDHVVDAFYRSIPDTIYWPVFIIATLAAIVASQATISATYSIIKQALALGCFPRVSVVHTSKKFLGQIYIPDINWVLMILCIAVTAGFKNQSQIGNAYGTAVVIVMLVTTFLMVPIMLLVWKSHWILVVIFIVLSLMVELPYFTACINKVDQGGWVPLVVAIAFFIIMYVWHFCTVKRYEFEMHSKVSMAWILGLGPSLGLVRVPGIGFVYTELASGVPHIFSHFITNLPAIHSVVVFVCVKYLPVYTVPVEERFIVKRIGPKNFHMFRCVARYGYKDIHKRDDDFEKMLLDRLLLFVRLESMMDDYSDSEDFTMMEEKTQGSSNALLLTGKAGSNTMCSTGDLSYSSQDSIVPAKSPLRGNSLTRYSNQTFGDELEFLNRCKDAGVVHILGNTIVHARPDSGIIKKVAVNYVFAFLRKICRENSVIFNVPHESLLNVGQIYYI
ncbi:putative potassium transporter 12 isoform X2 [Oryza brachyantha]|uniref:putative potassium transporter 12 isoform X2 n=1 Tax=Oryza brachyantha TaxID=4533 RepID=UPI000776119D|nr:putative potassium transporter 12 isoform X2 [Oryza brachyantha]